jgi:hypothetical protein
VGSGVGVWVGSDVGVEVGTGGNVAVAVGNDVRVAVGCGVSVGAGSGIGVRFGAGVAESNVDPTMLISAPSIPPGPIALTLYLCSVLLSSSVSINVVSATA